MAPPPVKSKPIVNYKHNLFVLEDGVAYRKEVVHYLQRVESVYAGRTLTKFIYASARQLLIVPYVPNEQEGWVNAFSNATPGPSGRYLEAYPKGTPIPGSIPINIPGYGTLNLPTVFVGTGAGSTVIIRYHPANARQFNANRGFIDPGSGPGELLYHEMVHALQLMQGAWLDAAIPENPHMDNHSEFCAIVAANIYRSEWGFTHLRDNHRLISLLGKDSAGKDLTNPAIYAEVYARPLEKWFNQQPAFCAELARSAARFNPLKFTAEALGKPVTVTMSLPR